jgi:predicted AAA+ superfamily ATPase
MRRIFLDFLKNRSLRARQVPLLVRGARQTGKSHIIRQYGSLEFAHLAEVNLELSPHFKECFKSLNTVAMCRDIEVLSNTKLVDGKSLLFIDEIQESAEAILSLRAFKEQRSGLDLVAAGSLIEFALDDEALRTFPVGRINFAWLHPMSFREFIDACGETQIAALLSSCSITKQNSSTQISAAIHQKLLGLIREYFVIGGMPEVVDVYRETKSYLEAKQVQSRLSLGYVADFVKYRGRYDHRKLQTILSAVPRLVGKQFKFSQVDTGVRARDLKQPLMDLEKAGLVRLVRATSANGVPLASEEREGKFKVQFLDIGLMLNMLGLNLGALPIDDALFANEGALAEQFVGQELLANESPDSPPQLYYWHREAKGAEAEVDFVLAVDGLVIPIEIKAGTTGALRSLRLFMKEKNSKLAIRISQQPLSYHDGILSVPFYLCGEIPRLARELAV